MGRTMLSPFSLAWGCPILESSVSRVGLMVILFESTYENMPSLPGLLLPLPLTPQQATVNPHLPWRLPNTHRQDWLCLLWGHCSFCLGPGVHWVCCKGFRSHRRFPILDTQQRDWEILENLTESQRDLIIELPYNWGNRLLEGTSKTFLSAPL